MVKRSHDEIDEMCRVMRDHLESESGEFGRKSYEDGCIAVVKWLFFQNAKHPADTTPDTEAETVRTVQKEILVNETAQAKEGSDA